MFQTTKLVASCDSDGDERHVKKMSKRMDIKLQEEYSTEKKQTYKLTVPKEYLDPCVNLFQYHITLPKSVYANRNITQT